MERERIMSGTRSLFWAVLTAFALCVDMPAAADGYWEAAQHSAADILLLLFQSARGADVTFLILFPALFITYEKLSHDRSVFLPSAAVVAALFSGFLLIGQSYEALDSWDLIFGGPLLMLLSCLKFFGFSYFFYALLSALFRWLDRDHRGPTGYTLEKSRKRRLFLLYFAVILLCWSPYLLICRPGSVTYDGIYQLGQYFGTAEPTSHHPWISTLLMGSIVELGRGISLEAGIFLYVLFQSLVCAAVFGGTCLRIRQMAGGRLLSCLALAYFALVPTWGAYAQMFVKDTLFYGVFGAFFLYMVLFAQTRGRCAMDVRVMLFLCGLSCTFLRNNGIYVVVPSLLCLAAVAEHWRDRGWAVVMGAVILGSNLVFTQAVLPALGVAPGSVREMLSLPFQQTARYVVEYGDELTPEEIELIDRVLDYETIAERYDPRVSDAVKNTYHGTSQDLKEYFRFWLRCGLNHPGVYLEAAANSMFGYFLPGYRYGSFGGHYFFMQDPMYGLKAEFAHPEAVKVIDGFSRLWSVIPGLLLLNAPGFHSWLLILCSAALLRRKKWRELLVTLPLWITLAINCVSPVNGLLRYVLPMMAAAPLLVSFTWDTLTQTEKGGISSHG